MINNRIYFPRLILAFDTLCALSLTMAAVVLIQLPAAIFRGTGYALVVLSVLSLLPCAREWISPSHLELSGDVARIKWNNWRVSGNIERIDFPAKKAKRLAISLSGAETHIDPVGPLFLLSSLIISPAIRPFVPPWWTPLYVTNKKQLDGLLGMTGERSLALAFPARVFGRRKLRRVLGNATSEI